MKTSLARHLDSCFDRMARPEVSICRMTLPAYHLLGYAGFTLAVVLTMILTIFSNLSSWTMSGVIGASILTFFGLAMVTKIIAGEEQLIYYHHEIAVMVVAALLLKIMHQPILPYLDITILGIGAFFVCGRVGCLMAGCCHGRPHKWGTCYRKEHVDAGFTHYYEGVRLFPIQAVESIWVLFVVTIGVAFILTQQPPGQALAWYVIHYDIGRFIFEFARGDPQRPYYFGFSEGQWISIILMVTVVCGEAVGLLPFHLWHAIAAAGIVSVMITVAVFRKTQGDGKHQLLNPRHVREVAEALQMTSSWVSAKTVVEGEHTVPKPIPMSATSLGIQISAGKIKHADILVGHYAFSSQNGPLCEAAAGSVADLIIKMKRCSGTSRLITGGNGVFHLLIHPLGAGEQR